MSIETPLSTRYRRAGWLTWLILTAAITVVVVMSIVSGQERSVTPSYRSAGAASNSSSTRGSGARGVSGACSRIRVASWR